MEWYCEADYCIIVDNLFTYENFLFKGLLVGETSRCQAQASLFNETLVVDSKRGPSNLFQLDPSNQFQWRALASSSKVALATNSNCTLAANSDRGT